MNRFSAKFLLIICLTIASFNLFGQGADVCGTGIQLLSPSGSTVAMDTFVFSTTLTPSPTAQNPDDFYFTITSVNQIFVDKTVCRDIWYRIQVPASGGFTVDLEALPGYEPDFAMALYSSCSGAPLASADDNYGTETFLEPTITASC